MHITGIAYRVVLAMVLLSRGFIVALKTKIGNAMLGLTVWMILSVPFSVWRTGSKDLVQHQWLEFSFIAFLAVAGLVSSYRQWFKLFKTLTYALLIFTIIANVFGASDNGRLFLQQGKFANPNEMAQALLLGLPLWGVMMAIAKSPVSKLFAAGVMALILATTFRTGSRGAMIGFLALVLIVFLRAAKMLDKLKIILAAVLFLAMVMTTMPGKLISRYKTVAEEDVSDFGEMDAAMATSASASTQSRKQLLRHSLIFTFRHPLFGVGPGMFVVADDAYMKTLGFRQGSWLGTHNSYTQISSELGIPGFLFFVAAVGMALKSTYTLYRRTRGDPRLEEMGNVALGFHYCMVVYAVTILFEHIAYTIMLPVFGGMAACLARTAEAEIQRIQSTPLPVTMSPAMFHTYLAKRPKLGQAV